MERISDKVLAEKEKKGEVIIEGVALTLDGYVAKVVVVETGEKKNYAVKLPQRRARR